MLRITYYCDKCGKELDRNEMLSFTTNTHYDWPARFELCDACAEPLGKVIGDLGIKATD